MKLLLSSEIHLDPDETRNIFCFSSIFWSCLPSLDSFLPETELVPFRKFDWGYDEIFDEGYLTFSQTDIFIDIRTLYYCIFE